MGTHVFIVNNDTFPIHLKYLFAGTGAYDSKTKVWLNEHKGLLSDIMRIRPEDFVIFYLEGTAKVKGAFYGIFKVAKTTPLVFHVPGSSGFQPSLPKNKLIYRTLLEPYEVYSEGIPEWEALDKLPTFATELQWTLIYRKLKGKRGCTPLLPWESERLIDMIRNKNSGNPIANAQYTGGFDWDVKNRKIVLRTSREVYPYSRTFKFDVLKHICDAHNQNKKYEIYLQMYFTKNIGIDLNLNNVVGANVSWFGNEVACGVGMQKIDILTICQNGNKKEYRIIELKDERVKASVTEQVEYYVNWASQSSGRHLDGAFNWNIQPVIVAPEIENKCKKSGLKTKIWQKVINGFNKFNQRNISLPLLYFEFQVQCGQSINFQKINYGV